jgi:putative oxidoreductase
MNRYAHWAPFLIRLGLGAVFIVHGLPKLLRTEAVAHIFRQVGLPAPYWLALAVGVIELVGGALLLAGYQMRLASALLALVMLGAIATVKFARGFVGGWEFDLVLLLNALSLFLWSPAGNTAPRDKKA